MPWRNARPPGPPPGAKLTGGRDRQPSTRRPIHHLRRPTSPNAIADRPRLKPPCSAAAALCRTRKRQVSDSCRSDHERSVPQSVTSAGVARFGPKATYSSRRGKPRFTDSSIPSGYHGQDPLSLVVPPCGMAAPSRPDYFGPPARRNDFVPLKNRPALCLSRNSAVRPNQPKSKKKCWTLVSHGRNPASGAKVNRCSFCFLAGHPLSRSAPTYAFDQSASSWWTWLGPERGGCLIGSNVPAICTTPIGGAFRPLRPVRSRRPTFPLRLSRHGRHGGGSMTEAIPRWTGRLSRPFFFSTAIRRPNGCIPTEWHPNSSRESIEQRENAKAGAIAGGVPREGPAYYPPHESVINRRAKGRGML